MLIPKLPDKHSIGASFFNYLSSDIEFIKKRKNVNNHQSNFFINFIFNFLGFRRLFKICTKS